MKKFKFQLIPFSAILIIGILFATCKQDKDDNGNNSGDMQSVNLQGLVKDASGNPLGGVNVVTGSLSATTDSDGKFTFSKVEVVNKRAVIQFEKGGYFTLTRSNVKRSDMFIDAVLYRYGNSDISSQTTFSAASETTLAVGNMKVALPASSLVKADGSAYTGTVTANMLYLDPNNENFTDMMPGGDLLALNATGSEVILISYGMTNVVLTDSDGKPLQLKSGSAAETTFPIPGGMKNTPATIPLWHFDDDKGIWTESGVATKEGDVYVGTVSHFSWCNLDYPARQVTIKVTVKAPPCPTCDTVPVPWVKVTISEQGPGGIIGDPGPGKQTGRTGPDGEVDVPIPGGGGVWVWVTCKDYDYGDDFPCEPENPISVPPGGPGVSIPITVNLPPPGGGGGGGGEGGGVFINGVRWATSNLDEGGEFAKNPEDFGAFYQWGRHTDGHESRTSNEIEVEEAISTLDANGQVPFGDPAYGKFITGYFSSNDWRTPHDDALWNAGTEKKPKKTVNDPCPKGWRLPTKSEMESLIEYDGGYITQNGVNGRIFGHHPNFIFLPAAGARNFGVESENWGGYYWSSSAEAGYFYASYLWFGPDMLWVGNWIRREGLSVRCVCE